MVRYWALARLDSLSGGMEHFGLSPLSWAKTPTNDTRAVGIIDLYVQRFRGFSVNRNQGKNS